jgi:hypothetical protein
MQGKSQNKSRARRGRPKVSSLTPREQARLRKKRQRAKAVENELAKVEILMPATLREAVKKAAGGKTLSEVGAEAFQLWLNVKTKS